MTYTIEDWNNAIAKRNEELMRTIVETTAEECGKPNSYCLTEVFCPECPMGLMAVQNARYGEEEKFAEIAEKFSEAADNFNQASDSLNSSWFSRLLGFLKFH